VTLDPKPEVTGQTPAHYVSEYVQVGNRFWHYFEDRLWASAQMARSHWNSWQPVMLTPPRKRRIEKNIFSLVLLYAVFHEKSEKKYEKILKIIFTLPPRP
jgi:hypothetical protein